jgi:hypothetical protein
MTAAIACRRLPAIPSSRDAASNRRPSIAALLPSRSRLASHAVPATPATVTIQPRRPGNSGTFAHHQ